ncbi:MAG TPA: hypothetical protein VF432_14905 [Thermoanaerobaculia bacterium]
MQPPPVLIAQSTATSNPRAATLDEALLWDYTFDFWSEERPEKVEVFFDDGRSESYGVPESEETRHSVSAERLDASEIRSARGAVGEVAFVDSITPSIENGNAIAIGSGESKTLEEHLAALFRRLRPDQFSLEVHYAYDLGGMPVEVPVVLVARQAFAEELIEHITAATRQWQSAIDPPATNARWRFALTMWHGAATLLRLSSLQLALRDVNASRQRRFH